MFLYTSVSFLDMGRHLLSLHYLHVIIIVKALLKKPYLKTIFFLGAVKKARSVWIGTTDNDFCGRVYKWVNSCKNMDICFSCMILAAEK